MFEFNLKWNKQDEEFSRSSTITYVGKKFLMFAGKLGEYKVCPNYASNNSYLINGI